MVHFGLYELFELETLNYVCIPFGLYVLNLKLDYEFVTHILPLIPLFKCMGGNSNSLNQIQ